MSRYLALDWDQQLLHVVSGTISGKQCIIHKAAVWHEEKSPSPAEPEELGAILKARLREAGIAPAPVLAIVPRDVVILKDLRIPAVPPHEEPAIVRFQTIKELTHREEDIVLDYAVMHGPSTASMGSDRRVLAVILRREMMETYQRLCTSAGLKLAGITPRPFGLAAALQRLAGLAPRPTETAPTSAFNSVTSTAEHAVAMVLLAGRWGEFSVFRGDIPVLTRTINVGGNLGGELRRNLAIYAGQNAQHPVRAVYLCGDISDDVRATLAGVLPDLALHTLDPFAGVPNINIPALQRAGFMAAVGVLSARGRKAGLPINFLEPRQPKPPTDPNRWLAYAAAAGLFLLIGVGGVYGYHQYATLSHQSEQLNDETAQLDGLLTKEREKGKKLQALDSWDNLNWLAEMHQLTQKIPDVDALRVTRFQADPLTRGPLSPHIAEITLNGVILDAKKSPKVLQDFIAAISRDPYCSVKAPSINGNTFTLKVKVEKRPLKSL